MRIFTMKNKITLLQLDEILPMVEYGIWLRVNGEANYISNNDIWNLILNKYGAWIVCDLHAEGPLNDGGEPHILVAIIENEKEEKPKEKPEHKLTKDDLVAPNTNNYRWFSWETITEEKKDGI